MQLRMKVTRDLSLAIQDVASIVEDRKNAERHERAVRRYREERESAASVADEPWWIDVGGEGEPC